MRFKIEKFEGPLGLLLQLIEKEEMDITQISLAKIADQYVDYIRDSDCISPEEMADFLVVAAKLLLIKSKALLPYLYPEEEEEIEELEQQLRMYKEFLKAAKQIDKLIGKKKFMFAREFNRKAVLSNINLFSPPKKLAAAGMWMVFSDLLARVKPPEVLKEETLDRKINIEDKILDIQKILIERIKVSFSRIMAGAQNKTEIIVSFLAVLELMRQREIVLKQDNLFDDILISKME
ncbi:MAG: segregation/condensation protein A [Patescibacteria group bacterium]|nr:segregation/condensation protein A [Patescibacteria group bacterium]